MGCKVSKQSEKLCRKRKEQLKLAVDRRYAFAYAQCEYNQSLYAVADAIRSFVASHSSPRLEINKQMRVFKLFYEQEDRPHEQKQMKPLEKMENDLDKSKNNLEGEKAKHHTVMKETHDMYVNGFQRVFVSF
ncbi:hypothetical protein CerSpe_256230 [Prunus speciosa]